MDKDSWSKIVTSISSEMDLRHQRSHELILCMENIKNKFPHKAENALFKEGLSAWSSKVFLLEPKVELRGSSSALLQTLSDA